MKILKNSLWKLGSNLWTFTISFTYTILLTPMVWEVYEIYLSTRGCRFRRYRYEICSQAQERNKFHITRKTFGTRILFTTCFEFTLSPFTNTSTEFIEHFGTAFCKTGNAIHLCNSTRQAVIRSSISLQSCPDRPWFPASLKGLNIRHSSVWLLGSNCSPDMVCLVWHYLVLQIALSNMHELRVNCNSNN